MPLNSREIKEATTLQLRALREAISAELEHRELHGHLFFIDRVDPRHLVVHKAVRIEDSDDIPRYVKSSEHQVMTLVLEDSSVMHQDPQVGNIFEITLVPHTNTVDVGRRVAVH